MVALEESVFMALTNARHCGMVRRRTGGGEGEILNLGRSEYIDADRTKTVAIMKLRD